MAFKDEHRSEETIEAEIRAAKGLPMTKHQPAPFP